MRSRRPRLGAGLLLATLLTGGCAHSPAPAGWLPPADASGSDAFGGWMVAEVGAGHERRRVEGELIAVEADTIIVLAAGGLESLPRAAILKATVAGYAIDAGKLGGWTTFGTISTLSHGVILLLSAPVWIITGSIATGKASRAPLLEYHVVRGDESRAMNDASRPWTDLALYARFPQGLPAGLDRATLRWKAWTPSARSHRSDTMKP
jgi:hypothetical protein